MVTMKLCISVVLCFILLCRASSQENGLCGKFYPQRDVNLRMILRQWYVTEIIYHNVARGQKTVIQRLDTCPTIFLSPNGPSSINLIWEEKRKRDNYMFDVQSSGEWTSMGHQTGSLVNSEYRQFHGNVIVLKAVDNHMVLTWCSETDDLFYTTLLSKNKSLSQLDINGVHSMLERWGLTIGKVSQTCDRSSATHLTAGSCLIVLLGLLSINYSR